jgi:hypothetical protein
MKKEIKSKEQKIELKNELKFEEMGQVKGGDSGVEVGRMNFYNKK